MRKLLRKFIYILDGTPAVYGNQSRGQSVVELALITPLLIVLIMGLVEIGWFANNFLILLEATRTGARFGTVQTGNTSPLVWDNNASYVPGKFGADPINDPLRTKIRDCRQVANRNAAELQRFYPLIACVVMQSMTPLEFRFVDTDTTDTETVHDDIIVSVFSLQLINPNDVPSSPVNLRSQLAQMAGLSGLPQVLVVGRYPTNANECNVDALGNPREDIRDPFDYIKNNVRDSNPADSVLPAEQRRYYELTGIDVLNTGNQATWERQRGFAVTGNHAIQGTGCIGSEWDLNEVQDLMNLPGFFLKDDQRARLPSMGMVLVELFWRHELLLKNPVFNPVWTVLGDRTTLSVWAAFPVPAAEPRIRFN